MANTSGIAEAFELLLEEIEVAVQGLREEAAKAVQGSRFDQARQLIDEVERLTTFHAKVKALRDEWRGGFATTSSRVLKRRRRKGRERLPRGVRTPEEAFRRPILEALVELGGSGTVSQVLDLVERKMTSTLNEYDRTPLPSGRGAPRWRNTAQWARYNMVREGLLGDNSGHGIWEITDAGRRWLEARMVAEHGGEVEAGGDPGPRRAAEASGPCAPPSG